ncbi:hypothetical protein KFE25_002716 [Diacronema lutheri]|uniref:Choline/carnitine acyltransferase domain-containing protein n=2 Tax=Diacronema lutheri TaxID=2081491 RepID=A0A8J5XRT4_DIALT|nr:hypothetical protein KFE25_002716 [Diacronema lutheri]
MSYRVASASSHGWWQLNSAAGLQHPRYAAHQQRVPRLPVPSLAESCRKYLRAVLPLHTSDAARDATRAAVDAFQAAGGPGPALHAELLARDAALPPDSSYIESLWYEYAYLGCRDPIPVASNPAVLLTAEPWARASPLWRAATLVSSVARWQVALRQGELALDVSRDGSARCMSTLAHVLGTARVPRRGCDAFTTTATSRHIVVLRRGALFPVEVIDADGQPIAPTSLFSTLAAIRAAADELARAPCSTSTGDAVSAPAHAPLAAPPMADLTCLGRDEWAVARDALLAASARNASSLRAVDEALLVLVLEVDDAHHKQSAGHVTASAARALHDTLIAPAPAVEPAASANVRGGGGDSDGDGAHAVASRYADRWYDKLQLVIFESGDAGLNFEHAPIDGVQVLRLAEDVCAWARACGPPPPLAPRGATPVASPPHVPLAWDVTPSVAVAIANGGRAARELRASVRAASLRLDGWTSERSRRAGVGLDALVQTALQLAYRMAHGTDGRHPSVYEACSTVAFRRGRTEVIRSASAEAVAFATQAAAAVAALNADLVAAQHGARAPSDAQLRALLVSGCAAHSEVTAWCQQGLGHERHLLTLRSLAVERVAGASSPPLIFTEPGWALLTRSTLSTSCLRSAAICGFSFGPVVPDGYGVGYAYDSTGLTVNVTSYAAAAPRGVDCELYAGRLAEAMALIGRLLDGFLPSKL